MKLYNVLTRVVDSFVPQGNEVTVYVCGVTPYDTTHLGHIFTYHSFDVLIRYLEWQGYRVRYAQNVTDIDDDILRKAGQGNEGWRALGNRWTARFIRDLQALNVRPPDYFPRATSVIPEIVAQVQQLLAAGVAYEAAGNVYFHVDAWPSFGQLSRLPRPEMLTIANERGNRPADPHKRDPLDFVLWQAQAPGEPAWDSPWGPGRPGWHVECSTLSTHFLGQTIDIHGGGGDLVFPHHECEIAQAECATGRQPFVRFWLHTAMVRYQGEKMSKSLGNLVMVRDLLQNWSPDALRLYLAGHHYRDAWSHDDEELAEAEALAHKLRWALATDLPAAANSPTLDPHPTRMAFGEALADDLDTPTAVAVLSRLAETILDAAHSGQKVTAAQDALRELGRVLGLQLDAERPEERATAGWNEHLREFGGE